MYLSVSEAKCGVTVCPGSCADAFLPESGCLYTFWTCPSESLRLSPVARSACLWWHCSSADQMSLLHEQLCVGSIQGKLGQENQQRLAANACPCGLARVQHLHGCSSYPANMANIFSCQ